MKFRPLPTFCVILLCVARLLGAEPEEIVVASYNVQNYVGGEGENTGGRPAKPKPKQAIEALVRVIKDINPDILGVCEMGRSEQFEDFKARLKEAGLQFVDSEYVEAADADRHLALLSRFPIVSRQSLADVTYELNGSLEKVKRGFLDVTVRVNPDYDLRMVGAHLKSKLAVAQGEALMRRFEAQLLRKHLEGILTSDPKINLLAYGDFNDTKNEPPIQEIMGVRGSATFMADLWAKDELGDRWTHYWRIADQYARIDYLFASPALFPEVVKNKSRVYRSEFWNEASDHRPIYTSIVPVNRKR
ncbi:endonuclease/exonuclease/phosphatase family protein [Verrucomicrobiota bacterium sgz303538]